MKQRARILLFFLILGCASQLSAQGTPVPKKSSSQTATAILEYFDDKNQVHIFSADGFEYGDLFLGMELLPGDRVQTLKSTAELRLDPNGSIIKLTANTNFQIASLKSASGGINDFNLLTGKLRVVAAKSTGAVDYRFRTPTAVCGVRGTDFGMEVRSGTMDRLAVRSGTVDFIKTATGDSLSLGKSMTANTFEAVFKPSTFTTKELADFYSDLDFVALNPATVPDEAPVAATIPDNSTVASPVAAPSAAPDPGETPASVDVPVTGAAPLEEKPVAAAEAPPLSDAVIDAIRKFLGIEIGAITIQNETYGKFILQPRIITKDFKAQFYLPIIYREDMFAPTQWYHPNGNDEWSFGTDQGQVTEDIVWDIFRDVFLKIKYIELFKQGDPFFLKIGNIPSMTLGHGILIGGYANDADFPAVRRLGINTGFDLGPISLEALVNDLANPEIFGARLVWRPVAPAFKTGAGISAALDVNPSSVLSESSSDADITATKAALPAFLNVAIDVEIPIIKSDIFGLMLYGDVGSMLPYFGKAFTRANGSAVDQGFQLANFITLATAPSIGISFLNYGIQTGVLGNIAFVDYRLEYQYFTGSFKPDFYDQTYDRLRGQRAIAMYRQFYGSLEDPTVRMGIYGQLGFNIAKLLKLDIGYKWPWNVGSDVIVPLDNPDFFMARLSFEEDALPFGIGFSIGLERQFFVPLFAKTSSYTLFDQYTVFSGSIEIPIANFFKIRVAVGTSALRDSAGALVLSNGQAVMKPTFTIESVF